MTATSPVRLTGVVRRAHTIALQWRLLVLWTFVTLIPTALMAWPFWATLSAQLDRSLYAPQWAKQLDATVLADLMGKLIDNASTLSQASLTALVLTLLLSPWLNSAIVASARAKAPLQWMPLLQKGLQDYGRMLRMWIWGMVLLLVVGGLASGAFRGAAKYADQAILESDATLVSRIVLLVTGLLLMVVHLSMDAGRAQLAVYPGRTSAVKAWWRGCKQIKARFWTHIGVYAAFTAAGLLLALAVTALRIALPQLGALWFVIGLVLAQLAIVLVGWMRIARLVALTDLAQARRDAGL